MPLARRATKLSVLLTIAFGAGLVFAQPAAAVWPGENGKIVFYKALIAPNGAPISVQIYSMTSQGQQLTDLSAAGGGANQLDIQPSVSPNGKRIAFVRVDPVTVVPQIWTMKIDGSDQTDISNDAAVASESNPSWTEDGSKILFVKQPAGSPVFGGAGEIWVRRSNGKGTPEQITSGFFDANPAMSPDGDLIAFSRVDTSDPLPPQGPPGFWRHLMVMKADGSRAATDLGRGSKPDWSPDSKSLVYGQAGIGPIMVVKLSDPTHKHQLTGLFNEAPVWSPDGRQIVFLDCDPITHICQVALMTATGQNPHDITNDPIVTSNKPDWQRTHGEGGENSA
jgi:Tol biopolymer transport system component